MTKDFNFDTTLNEEPSDDFDEVQVWVDSREQKPWTFSNSKTVALTTGDYSIPNANVAIERKTKSDFLRSITHERSRFKKECKRAKELDEELIILIEAPLEDFEEGNYKRDIHPNSIIGTVEKWAERYNIRFVFTKNRGAARERAKEILRAWNEDQKS